MWEMRKAHLFGGLSTRRLIVFVAGLLAATFSFALLFSPTAHAAPDATWEGEDLIYQENSYRRGEDGTANDPRHIPEGSLVYTYKDGSSLPVTMHFIYFAADGDPDTADTAFYSHATYTPPDTYTNVAEATTITLTPFSEAATETTSCNQEGVGWIICPVSRWLATGMDYVYDAISSYLEVRPLQVADYTENPLYRAWSIMRNFANVLFVIAFLIIIYSQITSVGISNFEIKKMLPRLVIAAILVNVSYWICAVAIDISNILGYSIQDIFMTMRESIVGPEGNSWDIMNWKSVTDLILTGGAAVAAVSIGVFQFVSTGGGSAFLLVPMLVGVALAALVALLILAARQAIITILLVISPLAFVAFLLPNTEKYFEKWRSLGTTMLLMFPIFSVLFGGAQLAGMLIIQNATHVNMVLLGLAVQVVPLVVTPLLIRFSGTLLGRIAGMVNNPNKGFVDRTRKWAEDRSSKRKSHQLAKGESWLANRARGIDYRRRKREGYQQANDAMTEANWSRTGTASRIQQYAMEAADTKELGESTAKAAYERSKSGPNANPRIQKLTLDVATAKGKVHHAETAAEAMVKEFEAGNISNIAVNADAITRSALAKQAHQLHQIHIATSAENSRVQSAQTIQAQQLSEALRNDTNLQKYAGGIDPQGAQRALAEAMTAQQKLRAQAVDNAKIIINYSNLSDIETVDLALGKPQRGIPPTADVQEAAIKKIASSGNVEQMQRLIEGMDLTPTSNVDHRTALTEAMRTNSNRPKFIGFSTMGQIDQGITGGFGQTGMDEAIRKAITADKLSPDAIVQQDPDALERIFEAIQRDKANYSQATLLKFHQQIQDTFDHTLLSTRIGDRESPLNKIKGLLPPLPPKPPKTPPAGTPPSTP